MKVRIPTNKLGTLSHDQRNLLIILEDAAVRFARDEVRFLSWLPEVKSDGLTRVACMELERMLDSRVREIRRGWPHDRAALYEDTLLSAVDDCDTQRADLRREIRAALVQKVKYQHIQRAEHIAVAGGLIDSANRIHETLTGKIHHFDPHRERLGYIDRRLECSLLNDGRLPDMEEAQLAFARLFDALCTAVLDKFTEKQTKN